LSKKILLVEDDLDMQKYIGEYLESYNYNCTIFSNPKEALDEFSKNSKKYDLLILDLMLPFMDGFDLLKEIKKIDDIPVIISSARVDIGNKIYGFEIGTDDYLAKPYEPRELILRIESILKRYNKTKEIIINDFVIDKENRSVSIDGYSIDFTKVEFEIFLFLVQNRKVIVSRAQITNATSLLEDTKSRTIDMHVSNIRYKIGDDSKNPKYIKSVWGVGYKFVG
jgi:DNA-binding response OmpR family regulator